MDAPIPPPVQPAYKDRRTGLIVFGVLSILIGAGCALLVPLAILGQVIAARRLGTDIDYSAAFIGAAVYGLLAVLLIWLGVGSVLLRRWARALLLCLGWIGLIIGLIAMPAVYIATGSIGETLRAQGQTVPPVTLAVIRLVTLVTSFVIYIVIPSVTVLFYRSPHVRQTCEARDPVVRWTDRCPLPVLALCLMQAFGAIMLLFTLPVYGQVFPLFGFAVQGWSSRVLWLAVIVFLAATARGSYRLELRTWWVYVVGTLLLWSSSLVTFQRLGLVEFYRLMGIPQRQLDLMARNPLFANGVMLWVSLLSMVVFLGYLLYVRRYFPAARDRPAAA